jgi:hypothetical protein
VAARRLVIVMLVLLGVSTLAAAFLPTPDTDEPAPGATDPTRRRGGEEGAGGAGEGAEGRLLSRELEVGAKQPPTILVRPGDQLLLRVFGRQGDDISIPAFGLVETMTPYAAARFDLIVDRSGSFAVRAERGDRLIGRIRSAPAGRCEEVRSRARGERSRSAACGPGDRRSARPGDRSDRRPSAAEGRRRR